MITIKSLLSISDFWGWLQIIGSILGAIFIYRYKNTISKKYIKAIEKNVEKQFGLPAELIFSPLESLKLSGATPLVKLNKPIKRNVSELAKKIVASNQKWRCAKCKQLLDFTYEIDHIKPLYKGGGNEVKNLRALCRGCHGKITLLDRVRSP
jgi:5-methylcytosine-specific restriction endonuclease McrA